MKANEFTPVDETMRGPDYGNAPDKFAEQNKDRWLAAGKHIGDIEQYAVRQDGIYYSVWDNGILVAFTSLSTETPSTVDDVWVNPDYRGQKIFSKTLWFYKTRLGRSQLLLGSVHSLAMQEVVTGLTRFNKKWVNIRTNDVEPFDLDTLDNFYSWAGPTAWRLVLENSGDFSNWPMFSSGQSYIYESYAAYVD